MNKTIRWGLFACASLLLVMGVFISRYFAAYRESSKIVVAEQVVVNELTVEGEAGEKKPFRNFLLVPERATFLSFWATWCEPCLKEIPLILESAIPQKTNLLFVNLDAGSFLDRKKAVDHWRAENLLEIETIFDSEASLTEAFSVSALPLNILLSKDGSILWSHTGLLSEKHLAESLSKLDVH